MAKRSGEVKMLSVREVAERVGAGESSIRIWAKAGRFPGAHVVEPPVGVPYWQIPESALEGFKKREAGRPQKPLSELKGKPRRKAQNN
jgi:hypothetical protein